MKPVADILADAREYIEKHGWTQFTLRSPGRNVCSIGAICYSQKWYGDNVLAERQEELQAVSRALVKIVGKRSEYPGMTPVDRVMDWNDDLETSTREKKKKAKQEVLDTFAKAEKIERAGFDPDA